MIKKKGGKNHLKRGRVPSQKKGQTRKKQVYLHLSNKTQDGDTWESSKKPIKNSQLSTSSQYQPLGLVRHFLAQEDCDLTSN